jgi:hypothetical protein
MCAPSALSARDSVAVFGRAVLCPDWCSAPSVVLWHGADANEAKLARNADSERSLREQAAAGCT